MKRKTVSELTAQSGGQFLFSLGRNLRSTKLPINHSSMCCFEQWTNGNSNINHLLMILPDRFAYGLTWLKGTFICNRREAQEAIGFCSFFLVARFTFIIHMSFIDSVCQRSFPMAIAFRMDSILSRPNTNHHFQPRLLISTINYFGFKTNKSFHHE